MRLVGKIICLVTLVTTASGGMRVERQTGSLTLGPVGWSVWNDGSVAVAIAIQNDSAVSLNAVTANSVLLGPGKRVAPSAMPIDFGSIAEDRNAVIQARFVGLSVPGTYGLSVTGSFRQGGQIRQYKLETTLRLYQTSKKPVAAMSFTVVKHHTSGVLGPPVKHRGSDSENYRPAAPVPEGPKLQPFKQASPTTEIQKHQPVDQAVVEVPSGDGGHVAGPPAPSVGILQTKPFKIVTDTVTATSAGDPPDPSVAVDSKDHVVLTTVNTTLYFSQNDGGSFTSVNPTSIFPNTAANPLCCDQVILYDPGSNYFFWNLQYAGSPNFERIAFAHPAQLIANVANWQYFDITQGSAGSTVTLDYPDLCVTKKFLYESCNGTNSKGSASGLIVFRLPLTSLSGASPVMSGSFVGPGSLSDMSRALYSRFAGGDPSGAWWAAHVDTSHLEVFRFADASTSVQTNTSPENTYSNTNFTSLAPDGLQWFDNHKPAGTGSILAAAWQPPTKTSKTGQVWFGWDAGLSSSGHPQPYVKLVYVNDQTLAVDGEYDIWNTPYAFAYPALGTNANGDVGVVVSFGGSANYASTCVGYLGDFVVYYVDSSDLTIPTASLRYGDYFNVRVSGSTNQYFSALGYQFKWVNPSNHALGGTYVSRYEQWGR